jgi:hypothetical protein
VVCVVLLLVVLSITGFGPHGNTPGLWIKGELVTTPVTDWSFTDKFEIANVQTRTWYLIPHSVTTYCVAYNGQLYLTSVYRAGLTYPHGRSWNEDVARDPHVRIKIGNQLYDRTLSRVTDESLRQDVLAAKRKKYPQQKIPPTSTVILFHVMDN